MRNRAYVHAMFDFTKNSIVAVLLVATFAWTFRMMLNTYLVTVAAVLIGLGIPAVARAWWVVKKRRDFADVCGDAEFRPGIPVASTKLEWPRPDAS